MSVDVFWGWLLGVLSSLVPYYLTRAWDKSDFCVGLKSEVVELRYLVVSIAFTVAQKKGRLDTDFFSWYREHVQSYIQVYSEERIPESIRNLINLPEKDYVVLLQALNNPGAFVVPPIMSPFIERSYSSISRLSSELQFRLFSVHRRIVGINQKFKRMEHWDGETFSYEGNTANYNRAVENSDQSSESAFKDLKLVAEDLRIVEKKLSSWRMLSGTA